MRRQGPLRWRRHTLTSSDAAADMMRTLAPATALARSIRGQAVEDGAVEFPDLPASPVEKAATLLRVAAQVEHELMVQYLYAGYSVVGTDKTITGIAVEEMSHLMTVQNLLRVIGEEPYLGRQDGDAAVDDEHRLFPFDFRLEPLSRVSLAKYVVAESPATTPDGVDPAALALIVGLATDPAADPVNRVGTLYALLGAVFGTPSLLRELAAGEQQPGWYTVVGQMASEAADFYGGPETLHLPDSAFVTVPGQASDDDWDRSKVLGFDEFRVHAITPRRDALAALRDIGLQGEGPSTLEEETAHFRRFFDRFVKYYKADGTGPGPASGVRPVPAGPRIVIDTGGTGPDVISDPLTARWARLGDLRYALLLGSLESYLRAPATERDFLRGWSFAEMYAVRKLSELLPTKPAGAGASTGVAVMPFTTPVWQGDTVQWSDLAAAFQESLTVAAELIVGLPETDPGHRLLSHLLASDERKLAEAQARAAGHTQRTRPDAVRDALDWAAGVGDPQHDQNGRFWNLPHADLVQVSISARMIMEPPPGGDALIVEELSSGDMPRSRPTLDPATSPEFALVKQWVADGCPDDPVQP